MIRTGEWMLQLQCVRGFERADAVLLVVVTSAERRWNVTAIETPKTNSTVDDVLTNHAHANLGEFDLLEAAKAAGLHYGDLWRCASVQNERCGCTSIDGVAECE